MNDPKSMKTIYLNLKYSLWDYRSNLGRDPRLASRKPTCLTVPMGINVDITNRINLLDNT